MNNLDNLPLSVDFKDEKLILLDQTKLPNVVEYISPSNLEEVFRSIKNMTVRGAPAIGITAAYGLVISLIEFKNLPLEAFKQKILEHGNYLETSRPTAVNLKWAIDRLKKISTNEFSNTLDLYNALKEDAILIHNEDKEICRKIGEHGKSLIKKGMGVLTHCNAGSLAVSFLGTATAPMYLAHNDGVDFQIYADETRPLLQGSRLTSFELLTAGLNVKVICDNMAASLMSQNKIDLVIVGTDRVARNGDVANKIGTLGVAILAKYFNIPFYVACPSSTIDLFTNSGIDIEIEQRESSEVTSFGEKRTAPKGINVENPAFDVTPHELVTGLITEKGMFKFPYNERMIREFEK